MDAASGCTADGVELPLRSAASNPTGHRSPRTQPLRPNRHLLSSFVLLLALAAPPAGRGSDVARAAAAPTLASSLAHQVAAARRVARAVGVHVVDLAERGEVFAYEPDQRRILASKSS